ncbi:MAG: recombinase family protein [Defluviitaleaceae bacterium]|nr:recombinase family protein [Defluviitaleaceae bacterium]
MKNAVIYARYSSSSQTEQSIEGQLRDCYSFAEREGFSVIETYVDRALTGRSDNRPDFQRMVADAKKKQFQYVIVYKLDRFTRNRYDSAVYKHKLKQCGVKVVSATENISDNPEGVILEAVLEASAEYYSLELSQKIKRGYRESILKGNFLGGTIPLGYKSKNKKLVVDEENAPIIKWVFEQYASGANKKVILDELTAKGIYSPKTGKPYGITAFQDALRSRKYIGILEWSDIVVENACPALIDKETFYKVQERLDANRKAGATKKAKTDYLLYGKLFCGHCGVNMIGDCGKSRNGERHHYYACRARKNKKECDKKSEKKDFLEWYVVEQTIEYVLTPARMEIIADGVIVEYEKEFNTGRIKELEKRLAKVERDIKKLFNMMLKTDSNAIMKNCENKIKELELQQTDIEIDISKLKIATDIRYTKEDIIKWLKTFASGDLFDLEFRKRVIDVFINSIYLYDGKVVIYYNIKGGKQVSYVEMLESTDEIEESENGESAANVVNSTIDSNRAVFGYQSVKCTPRRRASIKTLYLSRI